MSTRTETDQLRDKAARWDRLTEAATTAHTTYHLGMVTRQALEDDDEAGTPPPRP